MSTIYMMKGLPASGKTTLALEIVRTQHAKRVSKDDLRAMLHGGEYSPELETFVQFMRDTLIDATLLAGYSVVVDDTNLNPAHEGRLRQLAAIAHVDVSIVQANTPLEECIRRDRQRAKPVGEAVIREMYEAYLAPGKEL